MLKTEHLERIERKTRQMN